MAYDPKTGEYKERDHSVSKKLTGLLATDNPYMQQAETQGLKAANRRGLLNSSNAISAAQSSRISAALPIASQEAAQSHERNVQGRSLQMTDIGQQRDITSREKMQGLDISSREKMQGADIEATRERLEMELGSRTALQSADNAAQKERLGMQLTQQESLALRELRAAEKRLGMELDSREGMFGQELEHERGIAEMNVAANERNAAAQIAQAYEATYSQMVSSIMSNPEIPAAERQKYLDHAARVRDSNIALVEQFYGIELQWNTPGTGGSGSPNAQPGGPPPPGDLLRPGLSGRRIYR